MFMFQLWLPFMISCLNLDGNMAISTCHIRFDQHYGSLAITLQRYQLPSMY